MTVKSSFLDKKCVIKPSSHPLSKTSPEQILSQYLGWAAREYGAARLYGGLSGAGAQRGSPVKKLADVFVPLTLERFLPLTRDEMEEIEAAAQPSVKRTRNYLERFEKKRKEAEAVPIVELLRHPTGWPW